MSTQWEIDVILNIWFTSYMIYLYKDEVIMHFLSSHSH